MEEITTFLMVLGIVLAIVTVVGHGIWVGLAALFGGGQSRATGDEPGARAGAGRRTCPRCGTALGLYEANCVVCGWPAGTGQLSSQAALRTVREQVERLARLGLVDAAAREKLVAAVAAEEQRVAAAAVAAAVAEAKPQAAAVEEAKPQAAETPVAEVASAAAPVPLGERARKYAASREAAAEEALAEPVAPAPEPKRREAIARLLAAFMEEKNIRWGELVGGLLIVGCSIALVISFWSEIAERPLLKFVLFNGVTAALFGVGLYTDRRWKIHTTSHGILLIATLLVPLNFLAIAAFTDQTPPTDLLSLGGEALSLIVFAALVFLAGRILVPDDARLLVAGVMIPSLMQLVGRRFAEPATPLTWLYVLAAVPIAVYLVSTSIVARRRRTNGTSVLDETDGSRLLAFLGIVSFATFLPLALLAYKVPPLYGTLHRLSPLVVACGLPAMLVGLLFWRQVRERRLSGLQTAGVAVGVLGALVMIGAVVLAWPEPATLLPTALLMAGVLTVVAVWFGIPAAHVPAGLALAGAWLIGFHLLRGNVTWLLPSYEPMSRALLSAASGHALVPLVGVFGALAWSLSRKRGEDGRMIGLVAAVVAAASLGLVLWFGFGRFGDPENATWTLAIYAVAALAAATVLDRAAVAWIAAVLLFATLVQWIVFRFGPTWQLERPRLTALLAYATLAVALHGGLRWWLRRGQQRLQPVLAWSALAASLAGAGLLAANLPATSATALAIHLAWLAGVWLVLASLAGWPALLIASQVAVVLAIFWGVTAAVEMRAWYAAARHPWLDPWFLEAQGVALAGYCLLMSLVRRRWEGLARPQVAGRPWRAAGWEAKPQAAGWTVEHVSEIGLVMLLAGVAYYAVMPGTGQELEPLQAARGSGPAVRVVTPIEQFEIAGMVHAHAADRGGWELLAAVAVVMIAGLWQRRTDWRVIGLLVAAAAVCALVAARWEPDVAVASALRWLTAGFFAVASVPVWMRGRWGAPAVAKSPLGHELGAEWQASATMVRDFLLAAVALVYVAMGAYVFQAALWRAGMPPDLAWLWPYLLVWAVVAGVAALFAPRVAIAKPPLGELGTKRQAAAWGLHVRDVLLLLAVAPLAILVTFAVATALDQHPIVGPELGSWFRRIGWDVSYGVPLGVIGLTFVGYAIRDRSSGFAFAAGLLFNAVATIVVLMRLARGGGSLDAAAWITVAQVNALVAGVVGLVWLAAVEWEWRQSRVAEVNAKPPAGEWPLLLVTQVALAAALCGTFLAPAIVDLALEAPRFAIWVTTADGVLGWSAAVLATVAAVWINWRHGVSQNGVALFAAALVALIALTASHWDTGNWLAHRTLLAGVTAAAWLVPVATRGANRIRAADNVSERPMVWSAMAVRLFAVAAVYLAVVRAFGPTSWKWLIGVLVAISARNVWIAWYERRRGFMWIAAVLCNIAASAWWTRFGVPRLGVSRQDLVEFQEYLWINAIALAAMGMVSVWVQRTRIVPLAGEIPGRRRGLALHRFAAWAVIVLLLVATGAGLLDDLFAGLSPFNLPVAWAAWLAAVLVAAACMWDPAVRWPVAAMYCVGLVGVGMFLDGLNFRPPLFHWALALALAAYSLATSALWSARDRLRWVAERWGMPVVEQAKPQALGNADGPGGAWFEAQGHAWLVPMNFLLGVGVLMLVWWIELTMEQFPERIVAGYAVGAQAFALGLLARGAVRTSLQYLALVWGVVFAVAFAWAWLPPDFPAPWLHRLVVSVAALAATVVVYGFGLVKFLRRENEWTRAAAQLVPLVATLAVALILAVLGIEVAAYLEDGSVPIQTSALVTVCVALVGLVVAALVAALVPGRDPLGLSERGRTLYVYAAEVLAALLFLHVRVTLPWLFSGWFLRFWPMIVMVIAFMGVGLGELFQRRRQRVLSEPLENTGALLPLLPALAFWVMSSQLYQVHYSLLLLSIGVLYAALSVLRQSFWYGVLAAVAANGGLWYLLYEGEGLGLLEHPQLWLIPPALSLLAAGYINRERLTNEQSTALRYFSAIVIYVSSTADVFINGVAEAPWLPAVLAGLSILGVLAGIMLRVRAFLYLGTSFLLVAILTVIWYAAVEREHTFIWWVAGIVTGVAIIALFGLFEKRRDDVLRVVEQLKHWDA